MKICSRCKKSKSLNEFWNDSHKADGKNATCIPCRKKYLKRFSKRKSVTSAVWRKKNADLIRKKNKIYCRKNRERCAAWHREYERLNWKRIRDYRRRNKKRILANQNRWNSENRNWVRRRTRLNARRLRAEAILAYGGKCACPGCGERKAEFLTIDHKMGRKGKKRISGLEMLRWLKSRDWPTANYQLLCFNCNCAKYIYGKCPHVSSKLEAIL